MENHLLREDKEAFIQGSVKRKWYLDGAFPWVCGEPGIDNDGLIHLTNRRAYGLQDGDKSFRAFKELSACVDDDSALVGCEAKRMHLLPIEQFDKWLPMLRYVKKSEDGWREYTNQENVALRDRLYAWIRTYGLPHCREYEPDMDSRMDFTDIVVIAHLAATAYRLYATKNASIKNKATLITLPTSSSTIVVFGVQIKDPQPRLTTLGMKYFKTSQEKLRDALIPSQLKISLLTREPNKCPPDTWRQAANRWIGGVCELFLDIGIEIRYTKRYLIRPTLKPVGLLSWLWLHFLSHIGEKEEDAKDEKLCRICRKIITGRKGEMCEGCTKRHKTWLKDRSRKKPQVIKLASEGKTLEEIQEIVNLAGYQTKEVIEWIDKAKKEVQS